MSPPSPWGPGSRRASRSMEIPQHQSDTDTGGQKLPAVPWSFAFLCSSLETEKSSVGLLLVPTTDEGDEGDFCRPAVFLLMARGDGSPSFGHFMLRQGVQEITRDFEWESKLRMGTSSTSILRRLHISSCEA